MKSTQWVEELIETIETYSSFKKQKEIEILKILVKVLGGDISVKRKFVMSKIKTFYKSVVNKINFHRIYYFKRKNKYFINQC